MTDLKETAKQIFLETLRAIEPDTVIANRIRVDGEILNLGSEQVSLDGFKEVVLIGMGKASLKMGRAVEGLLGSRMSRGLLVTDRQTGTSVRSEVVVGGHPLPDANSLVAGEKIVELLRTCGSDALLIFLISGGGSALVELPVSTAISLEDLRITNQVLITCGATIREINLIRKSLSRIKGGGLGWLARSSKCVGLYISDVNPGDLRSIASNPLLPEEIGNESPLELLSRYKLAEKLPRPVVEVLERGSARSYEWSGDEPIPLSILLLDNSNALEAASQRAKAMGFRVEVRTDLIEGDYRIVADELLEHLLRMKTSFPNERVCVISGGEVSCPVRGDGIGGRNQEFVLYSATRLGLLRDARRRGGSFLWNGWYRR